MKSISLAIVGATGVVGRKFIEVLAEKNIPIIKLVLFASERSVGKVITFNGHDYPVILLNEENIRQNKVDFALFSAGSSISLQYAPIFKAMKTVVIDNSSAFRMYPDVPLVVPEVNPSDAYSHDYIIANPNCSTIQSAVALKPLHDAYTLKRVVVSTYQAVSGAGSQGIHDLYHQLKTGETSKFPYQIHQNVIPHIDVFLENGYTKEEEKIILEMRKILHLPKLKITATAVRVPVLNGHSESINVEFTQPFILDELKQRLANSQSIKLTDNPDELIYPMPIVAANQDDVYVGRIRRDESIQSGINMFVVADNLRKGAATNAIQILELLIQE
ncbi:MAG: aspartate-semialdehyde dehydrogenase [Bacilli bacterium]|nr:aspartate-semialdehyde dehydrogenase [Bacilli bacterium]